MFSISGFSSSYYSFLQGWGLGDNTIKMAASVQTILYCHAAFEILLNKVQTQTFAELHMEYTSDSLTYAWSTLMQHAHDLGCVSIYTYTRVRTPFSMDQFLLPLTTLARSSCNKACSH
jgi:hypothetical protein